MQSMSAKETNNIDTYDAGETMDCLFETFLKDCSNGGIFLKCNEEGKTEFICEEEHKEIMARAGKTYCLNCSREEYLIDIKELNIVQCEDCGKVEIEEVEAALLTKCKHCCDKTSGIVDRK